MTISESRIEARTALLAAFQQDAAGCREEWALYKSACDVLNGIDPVDVCATQPVTVDQVSRCIQLQRERAVVELTAEQQQENRKDITQ